jgi:hypothetical protein
MADTVGVPEAPPNRTNTTGLISAFYLEIEYLLDRVERASNHYHTLGIERSAVAQDVNDAYEKAVVILQPPHQKVRDALPEGMRIRIGEAFAKVSEAYDTLIDAERRAAYEGAALSKRKFVRVQPLDIRWARPKGPGLVAEQPPVEEKESDAAPEPDNEQTINIRFFHEQERVFVKVSKDAAAKLRRCERFKLSIPALVTGYERSGTKWKEVTKTLDVSRVGAAVRMSRRIKHGVIVHVILPLPTRLRSHGFTEPGYSTYAIVRRIQPPEDGTRLIGLEFIGARPPGDFLKKPWATFRTQRWAGIDRRSEPRQTRVERIEIEYLDAAQATLAKETAVSENVSASGARVRVKQAPADFEWLRVKSLKRGFESLAVLRNQYVGKDGIERLCLEFFEHQFPDMPTSFEESEQPESAA